MSWFQEAIDSWKSPLFGTYFQQTGYVVAAAGGAPKKAFNHLEKLLTHIGQNQTFGPGIKGLDNRQHFLDYTWQISGPLTGFKGYYNRLGGYANSADTLRGIFTHCAAMGVKIVLGEEDGRIQRLIYEGGKCVGVEAASGKTHRADLMICAIALMLHHWYQVLGILLLLDIGR